MKKLLFGLMLLSSFRFAFAQERSVTGRVTTAGDGLALPGANIQIKGMTRGTNADADGNYRINVTDDATFIFSFIGVESQQIKVGSQTTINVALKADTKQLQEVVVTALGAQREKRTLAIRLPTWVETRSPDPAKLMSFRDLPQKRRALL